MIYGDGKGGKPSGCLRGGMSLKYSDDRDWSLIPLLSLSPSNYALDGSRESRLATYPHVRQ